jgi:excisionase family DNA binding protein
MMKASKVKDVGASALIGSSEAARILKCSSETVRRLEARGVLPSIRTTRGMRLFFQSDVERYAEGKL